MTFFPLINILFLVILYFVHRRIFYITTALEIVLYVAGSYVIYSEFARPDNQFLWTLALTGAGFIMALIAFFVAISLNHKHLYENHSS